MEIIVSLDNVTLTAYISSGGFFAIKNLVETHTAIYIKQAMTDMFRAVTRDGDQVILLMDYDKLKGQAFNARPFRLEFNPNKLRQIDLTIIETIIPNLEDISITRTDLAFDLLEVDCSEFIVEKKGRPVATKYYLSQTGRLETKYLGASRSEKQIRLYDKKVERLANGSDKEKDFARQFEHWWRLEFQLRNRAVEEVFDVIHEIIFKPNQVDTLSFETQLYLSTMLFNKPLWSKVHRNTRAKYKKILENLESSDIDYLSEMKKSLQKSQVIIQGQLEFFSGRKSAFPKMPVAHRNE
ncbi:replication initiation protein [Streptococcus suis]|uniref:replication initiation protein n=1 Tax=Streptococcus suis TaxID=1307 RepID=UPI000CF5BE02|nr:replication initiation protein [Streptococcus suis]